MKKLIPTALLFTMLFGCNMNPNKEARIKQLESDFEETMERIDQLESKVQLLEIQNEEIEVKIRKLQTP